jgi:ribose/xylose/arabinose/galactoside ABC-type transport system permease subunit
MAAGVVGSTQAAAVSEGSTNPKQTTVLMVIFAALVGGNCSGRRFGTVIGAVAGAAILVVLEYYLRIMEAMKSEMAMMIIASAAGAGLLLSHLTYCLINRLYRKSRQKAEA